MAPARPFPRCTACLLGSVAVIALLASAPLAARGADVDDADTGKKVDKAELLKEAKAPATKPAIEVSPEVRAELDALAGAYRGLKSLRLAGKISADLDINGEQRKPTGTF